MPFGEETPLEDVLKHIKAATPFPGGKSIPIYVDPIGLSEADKTMASTVRNVHLDGVPLKTSLRLLLDQLDLAYSIRNGFLQITSAEDPVTPVYIDPFMIVGHCLLALVAAAFGALVAPLVPGGRGSRPAAVQLLRPDARGDPDRCGPVRSPIAALMGAVLVFALGLAALRIASPAWAGTTVLVTCGVLCFAIVGVVCCTGGERTWWLGFALFGWGWLLQAFWSPFELPTADQVRALELHLQPSGSGRGRHRAIHPGRRQLRRQSRPRASSNPVRAYLPLPAGAGFGLPRRNARRHALQPSDGT